MTKVYLAARYSRRDELRRYQQELADLGLGIVVTSRWLTDDHLWEGEGSGAPFAEAQRYAREDLEDIIVSHLVVCFTEPPRTSNSRGGRHVEFGYSLAKQKPIIVVGPRENVFYTMPGVMQTESWGVAKTWVATFDPEAGDWTEDPTATAGKCAGSGEVADGP